MRAVIRRPGSCRCRRRRRSRHDPGPGARRRSIRGGDLVQRPLLDGCEQPRFSTSAIAGEFSVRNTSAGDAAPSARAGCRARVIAVPQGDLHAGLLRELVHPRLGEGFVLRVIDRDAAADRFGARGSAGLGRDGCRSRGRRRRGRARGGPATAGATGTGDERRHHEDARQAARPPDGPIEQWMISSASQLAVSTGARGSSTQGTLSSVRKVAYHRDPVHSADHTGIGHVTRDRPRLGREWSGR